VNKSITIKIFNEIYYLKVVGIYYPENDEGPEIAMISNMYKPKEYLDNNNKTMNLYPIPKEIIEKMVRDICYMFQNNIGVYKTISKAHSQTFISKETHSMELLKEYNVILKSDVGSMTLQDLKNYIDNYSIEEQKRINIAITLENTFDVLDSEYSEYLFSDKNDNQRQYIKLTKLDNNIYPVESLVSTIPIDETTFMNSFAPEKNKEMIEQIVDYKNKEIEKIKNEK
jgi:predicted Fe-Mo cluster-binding NifX family protein